MKILTRYWIELENQETIWNRFGVTAFSIDDAMAMIMTKALKTTERPEAKTIIEDVDIRELEQNHVAPNIGAPTIRGIWFPKL
jgi:hypothetical protein